MRSQSFAKASFLLFLAGFALFLGCMLTSCASIPGINVTGGVTYTDQDGNSVHVDVAPKAAPETITLKGKTYAKAPATYGAYGIIE